MNHYGGFFEVSIHAHFVAMLMALYKLGDRNSESASLRTLLAKAKSEPGFSLEVLASSEAKLDALQMTWNKVKTLRHKLFAHRDRGLDYEEVFSSVHLTGDQLRALIDDFLRVLNEILYYRQRTTWRFDSRAKRDVCEMLDDLNHLLESGNSKRRSLKKASHTRITLRSSASHSSCPFKQPHNAFEGERREPLCLRFPWIWTVLLVPLFTWLITKYRRKGKQAEADTDAERAA